MIGTSDRNNSFDFIRFAAAVSVLVSHHFALSGFIEPFIPVFRDTLGGSAVAVFFVVSGYLICESLQRSNRWSTFFAARFLRIMPNLAFALVCASAVMLLWFSNYANLSLHIDYVIHNLGMFFHGARSRIPGILTGQPSQSINGSIWTLPYEFWLYVSLFCIFLLPSRYRLAALLIGVIVANGLCLFASEESRIFFLRSFFVGKLGLYFLSGALVAVLWPLISARRLIALSCSLIGICLSRSLLPTDNLVYTISLAVLVVLICTTSKFAAFGRYGDASYGIYILAFPIQQLAILSMGDFWLSMVVSLIITVACGYITWHTFERKCLGYKARLAAILSGGGYFSKFPSKGSNTQTSG
ncbi:acyltransferase [Microvirga sp. VF16]|uniref:acyltransferase family protein n=1 Tax=Microvirga sp. VF16 TaxID=2807101 RepID=UPI00193CD0EE|nr:acyltransferase [Microvirga sp. VF16]QRM28272.1 acyltransferase [Microvirga sp. VF16]